MEPRCLNMKALSSVLYNEPAASVGCWGLASYTMGLLYGNYYLHAPSVQCALAMSGKTNKYTQVLHIDIIIFYFAWPDGFDLAEQPGLASQ